MNTNDSTKQTRFKILLDNYAVSVYLSWKLIDSGLLEKKIKVGTNTDNISALAKQLVPVFANELRQAETEKEKIKDIHSYELDYFGSAVEIANAYFDELKFRGNEWEYADLQSLFLEYKNNAEKQLEKDRNN